MGSQYAFPVDVWSLGVLAFMLLSGCAPFDTSDAQLEERQVCRAAAAPRLPPPTHYPPFDLPLPPRVDGDGGSRLYLLAAGLHGELELRARQLGGGLRRGQGHRR